MLLKTLFPHLRHFRVDSLVKEEQQITLVCTSTRKQAPCPNCQQISRRIHSQYDRTLTDVAFSGQAVVLRLRVHKFFCQHAACPQRIFTERLPQLCEPYGKQTLLRQPLSKGLVTPVLQQELACFSAQETIWLFVRDPDNLDEKQRKSLRAVCQISATAKAAYQLVQSFITMVHQRTGNQLDTWLETVAQSQIAELQSFAVGIERDKAAVVAGLTLPYSNGQVEGQITKLKLIKRSIYGRAGLDLLKVRVLSTGEIGQEKKISEESLAA